MLCNCSRVTLSLLHVHSRTKENRLRLLTPMQFRWSCSRTFRCDEHVMFMQLHISAQQTDSITRPIRAMKRHSAMTFEMFETLRNVQFEPHLIRCAPVSVDVVLELFKTSRTRLAIRRRRSRETANRSNLISCPAKLFKRGVRDLRGHLDEDLLKYHPS